jgi:tetratricopeptide (TPR) repeat protein
MIKTMSSLIGFMVLISTVANCGPKPESGTQYQQYIDKGNSFKERGQFKDAVKSYKKALKIENNSAQLYRNIAFCYDKLNLPDSVITYYEGAIVYNPRDIDAYQQIAMINYSQQNPHEAMSWFDRAMDIGPLTPQSYAILGNIYYRWKEYGRSKEYFGRAIQVDNNYTDGYYGLGLVNLTIGDTTLAVDSFAKALQTGASNKSAYMLGTIDFNRNQFETAEQWFDQYLKAEPNGEYSGKAGELKRIIAAKKQAR